MSIRGIGVYLPPERVSNLEHAPQLGFDEPFVRNKIGVIHRTLKQPGEETSDLCVKAFENLTATERIDPASIELLCVVTQNPDCKVPHTAAIVHQKLGLGKRCMTFDLSQGCAGFTHGVQVVEALIKQGGLQQALLFTCDPYSKIVDRADRNTALLFGDAASVSHLTSRKGGYALIDAAFGTIPGSWECIVCKDQLSMDGRLVLENAMRSVPASVRELLTKNGLSKHICTLLQRELGLPDDKVPFDIAEYGNTVSSSIPILMKRFLFGTGHRRAVLSGFGVGFSWGTCLIEAET
jgi:3-oxoacyl-[acyl-carrier-protein] synthase-3